MMGRTEELMVGLNEQQVDTGRTSSACKSIEDYQLGPIARAGQMPRVNQCLGAGSEEGSDGDAS